MIVREVFRNTLFKLRCAAKECGCGDNIITHDDGRKLVGHAILDSISSESLKKFLWTELRKKGESFFREKIELSVCRLAPPGVLGDADVVLDDPVVLVKDAVRETGVVENIETLAELHSKLEAKVKKVTNDKHKNAIISALDSLQSSTVKSLTNQMNKLKKANAALKALQAACENETAVLPTKYELRRKTIGLEYFGSDNSVIA